MRSRSDSSSFRRVKLPLSPGNAGASRHESTPARPCKLGNRFNIPNTALKSERVTQFDIALRKRLAT